ncbi:MAG: aminoglycoside phosphotransferase [Nocardioidaceae bacterium]|nr:aminoglycoside phosphotransferase [Nocardioidaceae bacterium]
MREAPEHLDAADLLEVVRRHWDTDVDALEHLPVGFGAHHWAASVGGVRRLFVTFDRLLPKRDACSLEHAYAAAADLARSGLDFVLASSPTVSGYTVPLSGGAVSVTPWVDGRSGEGSFVDEADAVETASILSRLHASQVPADIPVWKPVVRSDLGDELAGRVTQPWRTGPFGEPAREAVAAHLPAVHEWVRRYVPLAERAVLAHRSWVPTHGEPDTGNHLLTRTRRYLVDWESLALAPRERDLDSLVASGADWQAAYASPDPDPQMLEMFDLEWRLSEIVEYSAWFRARHTGTASDTVAFEGLLEELDRPPRFVCDRPS